MRNAVCSILCVAMISVPATAAKRDPLNTLEVEQLRDATDQPNKRIRLLVQFVRARMLAIEQLRSDPKQAPGRGKEIHGLLEDFTTLAEELEDNLDMYGRHRSDMRKSLKETIEAYSEWQLKLRTLKETSEPAERKQFDFVLETAMEVVNDGDQTARELLQKQLQVAEDKKQNKKNKPE
jgi:hypothetical protein